MPMVRLPLTIELALLGFLRQRPMHGYEIHQRLSDPAGLGLVWRLKQSQLYALLARLEQEGHLTATLEPQAPKPPRKVFALTDEGHAAFEEWVESPVPHGRDLRLGFLAKLYFARREGPEVARRLVARQRVLCREWLEEQEQQAKGLRDSQPYDWLVHQFRVGQIEAMSAWLDTCEQTLIVPLPIS
jgi:DNA-binding PadR family transcriptional regulator